MQRENKWQDRLKHNIYANHQSLEDAKEAFNETLLLIQSELDTAIAEEREKFKYEMDRLQCEGISVQVESDWYINYRDLENYLEALNK